MIAIAFILTLTAKYCERPYFAIWKSRTEILKELQIILTTPYTEHEEMYDQHHENRNNYRKDCPVSDEFKAILEDCVNDTRFSCKKNGAIDRKGVAIFSELYRHQCNMKYYLERVPSSTFCEIENAAFGLLEESNRLFNYQFYKDLDYFKFVYSKIQDKNWGVDFWAYALKEYDFSWDEASIEHKFKSWMRTQFTLDLSQMSTKDLLHIANSNGNFGIANFHLMSPVQFNLFPHNLRRYTPNSASNLLTFMVSHINNNGEIANLQDLGNQFVALLFNLISRLGPNGMELLETVNKVELLEVLKLERQDNCAICQETFEHHKDGFYFKLPCDHHYHVNCISTHIDSGNFNTGFECPICRHGYSSQVVFPGDPDIAFIPPPLPLPINNHNAPIVEQDDPADWEQWPDED